MDIFQILALKALADQESERQANAGRFQLLPDTEDRGVLYPMPRLAPRQGETPMMHRASNYPAVREELVRERDESLGDLSAPPSPLPQYSNPPVYGSPKPTMLVPPPKGYFREGSESAGKPESTGPGLLEKLLVALLGSEPGSKFGPSSGLLAMTPLAGAAGKLRGLPALFQGQVSPNRLQIPASTLKDVRQALKALGVQHPEISRISQAYKTSPGNSLFGLSSTRAGEGRAPHGTAFTQEGLDELAPLAKKAYHERAKYLHPDKGGDPEAMKLLNVLYEFVERRLADLKFSAPHRTP